MKSSRILRSLAACLLVVGLMASPAAACPMCKAANEAGGATSTQQLEAANSRAEAYMYSIFFMMGMPPLVLGGLTLAIRREMRRAADNAETLGSVVG